MVAKIRYLIHLFRLTLKGGLWGCFPDTSLPPEEMRKDLLRQLGATPLKYEAEKLAAERDKVTGGRP